MVVLKIVLLTHVNVIVIQIVHVIVKLDVVLMAVQMIVQFILYVLVTHTLKFLKKNYIKNI